MKITIEIPDYKPERGVEYKWEDGFEIKAVSDNGAIIITANKEGLTSLANHLLNLAQDIIPARYHLHFDVSNSLQEGSTELIIEKI
ncbi:MULTISPECIES: Imm32 family immunity protein [Niastella]|uniref:Uncharacterized protein n=1 Tax=Niastella soli TaxID=2821487 RepID=A0ABS3YZS8_9BACT|nr:hypothetical protein [Niastella soli]MBO9203263.1 hypothetical protein [Niastella soli]